MADMMDPQAVEQQSQAEQENYKVYKRRWLVLFAMFTVILVVGLHRSLISIAIILKKFMDMTDDNYVLMTQISMYTTLISVLAMARALDYFGLRRVVSVKDTVHQLAIFVSLDKWSILMRTPLFLGIFCLCDDNLCQWIEILVLL